MTVIPRKPLQDFEKNRFVQSLDSRQAKQEAIKEAINNPPPPSRKVQVLNTKRRIDIAESPDLREARIAEEKRRADLKKPQPVNAVPVELELADKLALMDAFFVRNPSFARTQWNKEMLHRCMTYNIAVNPRFTFSSSTLDRSFQYLLKGGFLENAIRHRGDKAPLEFEEYVQPQPAIDINAKKPLMQPAVTQVISLAERQHLNNMPLDELAATVRRELKTKERAR